MNKSHPARRNHRIAAIAAKRFEVNRLVTSYYENQDVGYVSAEGNYMGGVGDRYRAGDLARRMVRVAMCNTGGLAIYARLNRLNVARDLKMEGY
jgi:hypothetical protein